MAKTNTYYLRIKNKPKHIQSGVKQIAHDLEKKGRAVTENQNALIYFASRMQHPKKKEEI